MEQFNKMYKLYKWLQAASRNVPGLRWGILLNEAIERWKQHFQSNRRNDNGGIVGGGDKSAPSMREVKDAIKKLNEQQSSRKGWYRCGTHQYGTGEAGVATYPARDRMHTN